MYFSVPYIFYLILLNAHEFQQIHRVYTALYREGLPVLSAAFLQDNILSHIHLQEYLFKMIVIPYGVEQIAQKFINYKTI